MNLTTPAEFTVTLRRLSLLAAEHLAELPALEVLHPDGS